MKSRAMKVFWKLIAALFCLQIIILNTSEANAIELQVQSGNATPGDSLEIAINVNGYGDEQVAAAVFTLTYNADYLILTAVESDFFDTFENQWKLLSPVPEPLPATSTIVDGVTYTQPLIYNTINSTPIRKTLIAGARVKSGTPTILCTLYFNVKTDTPAAIYPISIEPSIITNTDAGYSASGESLPILIGLVENQNDPTMRYPVYNPDIINGSISIHTVTVDSDKDGIEDSWELSHFSNLATADSTSDYDKDGYTDLQEYLNCIVNDSDPNGKVYDPTVKNAPGGTGYNPSASGNFWILMMPILSNQN